MLDPLLRGFVEAPDDAEADRRLATLLEGEAEPLIRRIAGRKLRAYAASPRDASSAEDVEDVVSDALLALVSRLQDLRGEPRADPIESFGDYTATVAHNAFAHYLRRKHPARSRLKNRLRYTLTTDGRYALWPTPDGLVCGLAVWRGRPASAPAGESLARMAAEPDRWLPSMRLRPSAWADPTVSLGALLLALGGPVEFDRLVGTMAALSSAEGEPRSVDAAVLESLPDETSPPADVALDRRREIERLWQEITSLPLRQRTALLLSLRDAQGAALLWVFPLTGVASIRQIAHTLEVPDLELAELWSRLPLDDLTLGARLGCARQQVINLRGAARKRLANRLGERSAPTPVPGPGNSKPVSASLRDEA